MHILIYIIYKYIYSYIVYIKICMYINVYIKISNYVTKAAKEFLITLGLKFIDVYFCWL
jgi:hypothetical protein